MKAELAQLIALQKIDLSLRHLQADLAALPEKRAEIEKEFDQRAFELREVETRLAEASTRRAALEAQIAEVRTSAERAERNLMQAKNEKDYGAAIREMDAGRKQVAQLETQILEQMEIIEKAEAELREREPEFSKLRSEMNEQLGAFDEQAHTQEAEISVQRAERDRLISSLPKSLSAQYDRLSTRIRDGIAVAEARNNACAACRMRLRPQVMTEVRRGIEIITCDNCSRILYYVPAESSEQTAPASAS